MSVFLRTNQVVRGNLTIAEAFEVDAARDRLLFVHAHDDDAIGGVSMLISMARAEGFDVHIAIATDGRGGYCSLSEKDKIVEIRRRESYAAYSILGIDPHHIQFMEFPDGAAWNFLGRRPATAGEPSIAGYTGLENSLTHLIRSIAPRCIFTPASTDLHPDHQVINKELLISIFHAAGEIWPELGEPCPLPEVYEYPTYIKMGRPPNIMIEADTQVFKKKQEALACYASQRQIDVVIRDVLRAGPVEFLRNIEFELYRPDVYKSLFLKGD